ncbi:ABC transporter substrate-binding protein [Tianweitania sp.]|uniref:ABC transporter substrate-binding protein n=1 Tax=Tianweitania sp. TaxID=2021634 RepID=UPI00289E07E5|nr:ABC transporter substrate-binding protein [Tianweitania sp.]
MKLTKLINRGLLAGLMMSASPVMAETMTIALKTEPSSLDPHYHSLTPNYQMAFTVFEPLVKQDGDQVAKPGLAESWRMISDREWEFVLRKDVKFSDGSSFTADDFLFSYQRIPKVPNSPTPLTLFTRNIEKVEVVDPLKIRITTRKAYPLLPADLAYIPVMSSKASAGDVPEGKTTTQLNSGDGLVGTGQYKFVSWSRGSEIVYERNDTYWGDKPLFDKVVYKPITNSAARVAALMSGGVDMVEDPPTDDVAALKKNDRFNIVEKPSSRVIFIALDQQGEPSPGITGTDGKNPLKDVRVRKALSLALDRQAIVDRVMGGVGTPAASLLPYPMYGTPEDLAKPAAADPEQARALLTEAGYPNGFQMVLGSPSGRYVNDSQVAQTIAALWTRIGVKTTVDAVAPPIFFKNRDAFQYSASLGGWASATGETSSPMTGLLATRNVPLGQGTGNYSRYANSAFDEKLQEAIATTDDAKRRPLVEELGRMAMSDYALLPVQFETSVWAMRKGLTYEGRADQMILIEGVSKVD